MCSRFQFDDVLIHDVSNEAGTRAFEIMGYRPKSVVLPSVILVASYYCLFRARVPEVHFIAEHESEKEERLLEKD